jgi:hypothetical protein
MLCKSKATYASARKLSLAQCPPFGQIIKTDDLWKIITWILSVNPDSLISKNPILRGRVDLGRRLSPKEGTNEAL